MLLPPEVVATLVGRFAGKVMRYDGVERWIGRGEWPMWVLLQEWATRKPPRGWRMYGCSVIMEMLPQQDPTLGLRLEVAVRPPQPHYLTRETRYILYKRRFSGLDREHCIHVEQRHYLLLEHPECPPVFKEYDFECQVWEEL